MRITRTASDREGPAWIPQWLLDFAALAFKLSLVTTVGLLGYLLWGLFSGSLADAMQPSQGTDPKQVLQAVHNVTLWLTISVVVTIVSSALLYYEEESYGFILTAIAVFLAFGLQFSIDLLFASDAARLTSGKASVETLQAMHQTALIFGVPGIFFVLRYLILKIKEGRSGSDLANLTYGGGVKKEERPRPLIGAIAPCWQLSYCRDSIRVKCPIFHAKTRCWKERVGCMCEENIILLAMEGGGGPPASVDMTRDQGFVPLGDLLTKPDTKTHVPSRVGPRGVRIPTNPHLSDAQKRERCRNCIIYNEHQRQKFNLLSPIVTLLVPALVYLKFEDIRVALQSAMRGLDVLVARVNITGKGSDTAARLADQVTSSFGAEVIIIACLTLVAMTYALRMLEYCVFKIKI